MPTISFVLPHWMYWSGLIFIPLLAMYIVRKQKGKDTEGGVSKAIAYMFWLCAGFVGIHRIYLRNTLGLIYIPIFIVLLSTNYQVRLANNDVSNARENISIGEFNLERVQKAIEKRQKAWDKAEASGASSSRKARLEKKLNAAKKKLQKTEQALVTSKEAHEEKKAVHDRWFLVTRIIAILILLMLLYDAYKLPKLVDECTAKEAREIKPGTQKMRMPAHEPGTGESPTLQIDNKFFHWIDKINGYAGEFVCFWSIIAVFVYYYEVLARYMFNSPTNWAHESMFLMFGMQYVLAAGFTNRDDAHVRVDVIYKFFPDRLKGLTDVFTSIFFFIFAFALLWTGWVFAADSMNVWEVSFTEWAIQYWPVKLMLPLGALLLTFDGLTKLIKDVYVLAGKKV